MSPPWLALGPCEYFWAAWAKFAFPASMSALRSLADMPAGRRISASWTMLSLENSALRSL